ncbi:MAG: Lanthionine biosynthesis protein LanB [bacterium]|nr:Lanthionine biosynthesis protein LanB [bacterium]
MKRSRATPTFALMRTPLLPIDEWLRWGDAAATIDVAADWLRAQVRRPQIRAAIRIASASLDAALDAWLDGRAESGGDKVASAVARYFSRMCVRPTPFGLFAGCSSAAIGGQTRLSLHARDQYRVHLRPDLATEVTAAEAAARRPETRASVEWVTSNSAYAVADDVRWVHVDRATERWSYRLDGATRDDAVELVLAQASHPSSRAALAERVAEARGVAFDDAIDYIDALIDAQLLTPAVPLGLVGASAPLSDAAVSSLAETAAARHDGPIHADLWKPADLALPPHVVDEVLGAVELTRRLAVRRDGALARFQQRFLERFEGASVPLLVALDEDVGLGFDLEPAAGDAGGSGERWTPRDAHLLARVSELALRNESELALTDDDVACLSGDSSSTRSPSFGANVTIVAPSAEAVQAGAFRLLVRGVVSLSPVDIVARFSLLDDDLLAAARAHARAEQAAFGDTLLAEIVHVPSAAVADVLLRPAIREFELPLVARSAAPAERQIALSDLVVSVEADGVVLRSASSGRRVLPLMTTPHDADDARSIALYRFLAALKNQDEPWLSSWSWGPLTNAAFLPRVVHGRLVLARAQWRLERAQLAALADLDPLSLARCVCALRASHRMPRYVLVQDADRALPVDFENPLSRETFARLVRGLEQARLVELFPSADDCCVTAPEGRFTHELFIGFVEPPAATAPTTMTMTTTTPPTSRAPLAPAAYAPGGDWLYAKLYCSASQSDALLRELFTPLVGESWFAAAVDRWFFLRYADPEFHLRLRFHGTPEALQQQLWPHLQRTVQRALDAGRAWRPQLDTYIPEAQRYGGDEALAVIERIFHADSEAALALMAELPDPDARLEPALLSVDHLLGDLALDLHAREQLMSHISAELRRAYDPHGTAARQAGRRYRELADTLTQQLTSVDHDPPPLREILARRAGVARAAAAELTALSARGRWTSTTPRLAASLVHLHVNRLFPMSQRGYELSIAELLRRGHAGARLRRRRGLDG